MTSNEDRRSPDTAPPPDPELAQVPQAIAARDVAIEIESRLKDAGIDVTEVTVAVSANGEVVLMGTVADARGRARAEAIARAHPAATIVENYLELGR